MKRNSESRQAADARAMDGRLSMTQLLANKAARELEIEVPLTSDQALDPQWLSLALGTKVSAVELTESIKTVATKLRFSAMVDGERQHFCLKGLLDTDEAGRLGGSTCVLEGGFYSQVAPTLGVRVPECLVSIIDRPAQQGVIIMRDLIVDGARFCSALEPFAADDAALSLEQVAALHQGSGFLAGADWIRPRVAELARMTYVTPAMLQEMMDGPRCEGLPAHVRSGEKLVAALKSLAARDAERPQFLVHGDSHAGNIFRTAQGAGLIDWQLLQRGGWALDVAYHLCAVLPTALAEAEERRLLNLYLGMMRASGREMPDDELAWQQYRESVIYGQYLWAITRRVDPPIIVQFNQRLGAAAARLGSYGLLGIS
jgi:Phosphotransferase enzyme family